MPATPPPASTPSACARCGAAFSCGEVAGATHCWCADLPRLHNIDAARPACLCPACLRRALEEQDHAGL